MAELAAIAHYRLSPIPTLNCSEQSFSYTPWGRVRVTCSSSSQTATLSDGVGGARILTHQGIQHRSAYDNFNNSGKKNSRVFFLDVNPLCYEGSKPCLRSFAHWVSLFFSQVSHSDPVIAVLDGERGNEYRRQLLPSYKAHRRKFASYSTTSHQFPRDIHVSSQFPVPHVTDVLQKCNVPVLKVSGHEADDVIATLVDQVVERGFRVVIGSPDKDFKQLISEDVQIVMPMPEFGRWSFYTLKHYIAQYNCDPSTDLSLRSIMGDDVDGVPGIQHLAPGFGRKTAIKLLKKHGSLENLLNAAAVRTVGKPYAQDALTKHADYLRKNYEVLSLRRDVEVNLAEEWLSKRNTCNDSAVLSSLFRMLGPLLKLNDGEARYLFQG